MKKVAILVLTALMLLAMLTGCGANTSGTDKEDNKTGGSKKPGSDFVQDDLPSDEKLDKFSGTVLASSQFADGLAVVIGNGETYGDYIINNKGEIIANLGEKLGDYQPTVDHYFSNGLMLLYDLLIDSKGNVTKPADVGVTKFYDVAFAGGYILAEITEATYDSTKMKLGIMNTDFQWVLEPTEELYNTVGADALKETEYLTSVSYYYDGYIYFAETGMFLSVSDGKTFDKDNAPFAHPSQYWVPSTYGPYWEPFSGSSDKYLDISNKGQIYHLTSFTDGMAGVMIKNQEAQKVFMALIDEQGNFLFEPVDVGVNPSAGWRTPKVVIDGEWVIVYQIYYNSLRREEAVIKKYDLQGNFVEEFYTNGVDSVNDIYDIYIDGGVITLRWNTYSPGRYTYLNTDFELLF